MKCGKCGGIWETNPKFKYCPFCGFLLPEEDISAILPGPAKMIKSFADRFGAEIFKDKSRCYTLFRTFINDNKEIAMMEFLLNAGAVEEILKCSAGFSEFDKERLCLKIKENLMKDFCSDTRLTEGLNWYTSALINFELKVASPVSRTIITSPSSGISSSLSATSPAGTISAIKKSGVTNTSTLEEFERYVRGKYALDLVKCPAGSFFMGSPMTELGRFKNEVQHKVTITRDFCIGKYPVTQALYKMIMGDNPSQFKGNTNPVECVIWSKAVEFCEKLNLATEMVRPAGYKFDLPTEAQWEYACRAGTETALNNGKNLTAFTGTCFNLDEVGWYSKNSFAKSHSVGMKAPNAWGIYDMIGNVWEWCKDWYTEYDINNNVDPAGPQIGSLRVSRGGSWEDSPNSCRSAYRGSGRPVREFNSLGFRLALVPSDR